LLAPAQFAVFPENQAAVEMFCRMATQWRVGMNGRMGLDYRVLEWLLSLYPVADACALLEDLQVMEYTILQEQS